MKFTFGKYINREIDDILELDPKYVYFLYSNFKDNEVRSQVFFDKIKSSSGYIKMPFGKFKCMRLNEIYDEPQGKDYLVWAMANFKPSLLKDAITDYLTERGQEFINKFDSFYPVDRCCSCGTLLSSPKNYKGYNPNDPYDA